MTMINDITGAKLDKSNARFFGIVAVFALAGPPIGGLVLSAFLAVLAATPHLTTSSWAEASTTFMIGTLFGSLFGLPIAYAIGILPAAGVGLAVAVWDRRKGLISWRIAVGAALVPWLFIALRAGDIIETDEGTRIWQISMLLASVAATLVCWWLARAILGRALRLKVG